MEPAVEFRGLSRAELSRVGEIDRTERIDVIYAQHGRELVARPGNWNASAWDPEGHGEHSVGAQVNALEYHVDKGGIALGAFAGGRLVGIAVVVPHLRPGTAQLAWLHVSAPWRAKGIGSRLSDQLEQIARTAGDADMVVSATPSENTVRFYRGRGFQPMAQPLAELVELEPDDVHMRKVLTTAVTKGSDAFDPATYDEVVAEIPDYEQLQAEVAAATAGLLAERFLDLGAGTGATTRSVLSRHPGTAAVLLDESESMLAAARSALGATATTVVAGLEDPMPAGPFDLVVSALAVHHLAGRAKADLFRRVADVLRPGGRFVLGDIVVPPDPADVVTPIDGVVDVPSPAADQLTWLEEAGLTASVAWSHRDLAVLVGDKPA